VLKNPLPVGVVQEPKQEKSNLKVAVDKTKKE